MAEALQSLSPLEPPRGSPCDLAALTRRPNPFSSTIAALQGFIFLYYDIASLKFGQSHRNV